MKVNVSVEATAQEMREFLGLPNVQPLHDEMMKVLRDNVQRGVDQLRVPRPAKTAVARPVPLDGNGAEILGSGCQGQRHSKQGRTRQEDRPVAGDPRGRHGARRFGKVMNLAMTN
jgi:hypothetical protein